MNYEQLHPAIEARHAFEVRIATLCGFAVGVFTGIGLIVWVL